MGGLQRTKDVLARTGARVDGARRAKLVKGGFVERQSLTLVVRPKWSADVWTLLPQDAEPLQVANHGFDKLRLAP
jgi:hypothetical protein